MYRGRFPVRARCRPSDSLGRKSSSRARKGPVCVRGLPGELPVGRTQFAHRSDLAVKQCPAVFSGCFLYTFDAADDLLCVDLVARCVM